MQKWLGLFFLFLVAQTTWAQEVDSLKKETRSVAIYPALGFTPETRWNFGAIAFIVFDNDSKGSDFHRPSSITPYAIYTSKKQILTKTDLDLYFKSGANLNLELRYFDFPDNYYGTGNETDPDGVELFTNKFFQLEGRIAKPFSQSLFVGFYYDFQYNDITYLENGMLEGQSPLGIDGGRIMGLGPGMQYDTRNSTLYPTDGRLFNAGIKVYSKVFGSEYDYTHFLIDYRQYFEFLGPKNVVAFQFKSEFTAGDNVPFYKLPAIAGDQRLRGIEHKNLYRDRQSMYFQVEGRQELFWRFGGVVFAGVGEVFDTFSNFNTENLRFVYGLGGRFRAMRDQKLNIRADVGFYDGQSAFFLSVREAF